MSTDRRVESRLADGAAGRCWRVALAVRLGTGAALLATGTIGLISTATTDLPISDPLTAIAIYAALWWFALVRPAVWLSPDELVVRNPLGTHRIPRDTVVSAKPGSFGVSIIRRDGRPCTALALRKPIIAEERAAGLITYWAQTPPSVSPPESSYPATRESLTRRRVADIVAAAGLAIALTIPALLLAWPHNPQWLWPVAGFILVIAVVPFGITRS
ncbi:hypothetical protein [Kribbella sp. NPDC051620]|uniref:hypothetical protein n=1 Tax=Kribbella sp. NPDC051620 TaxID=3364120 RepID=UPI00379344A6